MHISKITVRNYRLLKDFSVDLEENLSLIVGKNNSGKLNLKAEDGISLSNAAVVLCAVQDEIFGYLGFWGAANGGCLQE